MDWKKIAPWNWFRKEQEHVGQAVPVRGARTTDPLAALRAEMDGLFEDALRRFGRGMPLLPSPPGAGAEILLRPSLDISEGRKAYTVRVEIPGVGKDDVSLDLEDDTLVIRGEKKLETEESDENYHCVERAYGTFQRLLSLPEDADPERIDATFRHGVLKITIPKRSVPAPRTRAIDIQAG